MKVAILGSNGMLGSMLVYYFKTNTLFEVICITRDIFDALTDKVDKLHNLLINTDYVINCIGAIPQKKYTALEYEKLNTIFPIELAELCTLLKTKLIHMSTNCVFSGKKSNYLESDIPDAEDTYGKSKYTGEPINALTIRCSIIGPEKETSFGLMEWFLNNKSDTIFGYTDSYWNGLTTLELSKVVVEIIECNKWCPGLQHFYSASTMSKYEILILVNNLFGTNKVIVPKSNGLKYYTLCSSITQACKTVEEQLHNVLDIYTNYKQFYNIASK